MTDDLLTRLTTALMDAMGCKEASIFGQRLHDPAEDPADEPANSDSDASAHGCPGSEVDLVTTQDLSAQSIVPEDVTEWLRALGWTRDGRLGDIAQSWRRGESQVLVPTLGSSPDFALRWSEMLTRLSRALGTDAAGVLLAVAKAGSDIAEFRASGQIDDTLPGNCRLHVNVLRPGPKHMGWPCPVATQCAEALLPFVRSEVADTLERIARRWQFSDWADAPRDSDPVRERLGNAQYVTTWLLARAKEV